MLTRKKFLTHKKDQMRIAIDYKNSNELWNQWQNDFMLLPGYKTVQSTVSNLIFQTFLNSFQSSNWNSNMMWFYFRKHLSLVQACEHFIYLVVPSLCISKSSKRTTYIYVTLYSTLIPHLQNKWYPRVQFEEAR